MSIRPISIKTENSKNTAPQKEVSFRGAGLNPITGLMDWIDKSGYVAQFLTQDVVGMAVPRTGAALTRNKDKTGHLNYSYASLVVLREALSGPSAFIIPLTMLWAIKSKFGKANDVPINFIKGFGDDFAEFASQNSELLNYPEKLKAAYYKRVVSNILDQSTRGEFPGRDKKKFDEAVEKLANKLVEIDNAPKKKFWWSKKRNANEGSVKSAKELTGEFIEEFIKFKKMYCASSSNKPLQAFFAVKDKIAKVAHDDTTGKSFIETNIGSFINHLRNFTDDVIESSNEGFKESGKNIKEFIKNFTNKRVGSRFLTNLSMTAAVCLFYIFIPKLYNLVSKENPGLAGLKDCDDSMRPGSLPPVLDHKEEGK